MKVLFYQTIHCGEDNYIIRKKLEWNRELPHIGEKVTSASFLRDVNEAYTVKEVTHELLEAYCSVGLEDCSILADSLLGRELARFAELSGWECERI